jgi:tryptophan-rich sensory protein
MAHIHWIELLIYAYLSILLIGFGCYVFFEDRRLTKHIYSKLCTPSWAPPAWAISMMWIITYILEAVAYTMVRLRGEWEGPHILWGLVLFVILQFLMASWTWLFRRSLGWSVFMVIISLAVAAVVTWLFWFVNTIAGILMLIAVIWLLFTAILAFVVWWMNWDCDVPSICRGYVKITPC